MDAITPTVAFFAICIIAVGLSTIILTYLRLRANNNLDTMGRVIELLAVVRVEVVAILQEASALIDANDEGGKLAMDKYVQERYTEFIQNCSKLTEAEKKLLLNIDVKRLSELLAGWFPNKDEPIGIKKSE